MSPHHKSRDEIIVVLVHLFREIGFHDLFLIIMFVQIWEYKMKILLLYITKNNL